eukprot:15179536-Ditylum_brightwellii.AAC.1
MSVNYAPSPPSTMAIILTTSHSGQCMLETHYDPHPPPDPDPSSLILVPWNKLHYLPHPLPAPSWKSLMTLKGLLVVFENFPDVHIGKAFVM